MLLSSCLIRILEFKQCICGCLKCVAEGYSHTEQPIQFSELINADQCSWITFFALHKLLLLNFPQRCPCSMKLNFSANGLPYLGDSHMATEGVLYFCTSENLI